MAKGCFENPSYDNPKEHAGFFSLLFLSWMNKLLKTGYQSPLKDDDLYNLSSDNKAESIAKQIKDAWEEEVNTANKQQRRPRLWKALVHILSCQEYVFLLLLKFCAESLRSFNAILLWFYLKMLSHKSHQVYYTLLTLSAGFSLGLVMYLLTYRQCKYQLHVAGIRLKVALMECIYQKIIKTRRYILSQVKVGQIQNLVSNDVDKIEELVVFCTNLIVAPFVVLASILSLWLLVGWQSLAGISFIVVPLAFTTVVAGAFTKLREKQAQLTDTRLGIVHEIISGIRAVKTFAWEENYVNKVKTVRSKETRVVFLKSMFYSINTTLFICAEAITTLIAIIAMIYAGFQLSTIDIFTTSTIAAIVNNVMLDYVNYGYRMVQEAKVSLERIEGFLLCGSDLSHFSDKRVVEAELEALICDEQQEKLDVTSSTDSFISLVHLSATWNNNEPDILHNNCLVANQNALVIVTGPVGCGKTSLLMAIQGEIPVTTGKVSTRGQIAYVSQIPWIFSGTIRDNIVFGKADDEKRYQRILDVCDLQEDIKHFPKGDLSVIGQRGITMSGGQRARISLARAVYADADIFLLDDPLSAVDAKVGKRIFDKCICDVLSSKLRILVTHQLKYLPSADRIVVMKNGYVDFQGSYEEMRDKDIMLLNVCVEDVTCIKKAIGDGSFAESSERNYSFEEEAEDFIQEEEDKAVGHVKWQFYWSFFKSGSHAIILVLFAIFYLFVEAFLYSPNLFQSRLSHMSHNQQTRPITIGTYVGLVIGSTFLCGIRDYLVHYLSIRSSRNLHEKMTESVIKSQVLFFDTNSIGRIMNRFSSDTGNLDDKLSKQLDFALAASMKLFSISLVALYVDLWLILGIVALAILLVYYGRYLLRNSREIYRLEAISRSPVYAHISETERGLEVIRSLQSEDKFTETFNRLLDDYTKAVFIRISVVHWFALRVDLVCAVFVIIVAILGVVTINDEALTGMLLAITISGVMIINYGILRVCDVENTMTSAERISAYSSLPSEPGYSRHTQPPDTWPEHGMVSLQNVSLQYIQDGVTVLRNFNMEIQPNEKIGIVGRTGAGKSSLLAAILRMPEPQGQVIIDGVNLGTINIQATRRSMAVIPQDPVVFAGTLKKNLDPLHRFTDDEIWIALTQVQLSDKIASLPEQLECQVGESGTGFSVGERQLLCLARALLQRGRILLMDEATANVDLATDQRIQHVIRHSFTDCTVLTIAHRLDTIMDYDRVVVMDQGHVVEQGVPTVLAGQEGGYLNELLKRSGE